MSIETESKSKTRLEAEPESVKPKYNEHRVFPGQPFPLGATWDGQGVNFALFSEQATKVELCLFDSADDKQESHRVEFTEYSDRVWHAYLPDLKPGQVYGYRVYGDYDPEKGQRFNHNKLLVDPYTKAFARLPEWHPSLYAYTPDSKFPDKADLRVNTLDSAAYAPLGVVVDTSYNWNNERHYDNHPKTPWHKTIIYEAHVKGMTMTHPEVPEHLRGTYAGLATEPVINHLKSLGVTAIELLPVQQHVDEHFLVEKKLTNYWGYNTLGFFAPDCNYSQTPNEPESVIHEFKAMVRSFHEAGIEVILDVVYNHTAEGNHLGPTLSFKGIDNQAYYRLMPENNRYYRDYSGCGNTLDVNNPYSLQLVMDSLRYWVQEMHVDGFRFDLASALTRGKKDVATMASFFDVIHQDPVLSRVKLIAEPWDIGEGGYQVGNFPVLWTEWNGKYRDRARQFWKGDEGQISAFATRLSGSSDLYENNGRLPHASINFITCHDGFTLSDLVSYNDKHNEANLENNRDGDAHNNSWNCGTEGETVDPEIKALRLRQRKNLMATLLLSLGVPMISHGDELGRTQQGNNNAYCQDNELAWIDWDLNAEETDFKNFTQKLTEIRKANPVFQRRKFFMGNLPVEPKMSDIVWLTENSEPMKPKDWEDPKRKSLSALLNGNAICEQDEHGEPITGASMLLLMNAGNQPLEFTLPASIEGVQWELLLDTSFNETPSESSSENLMTKEHYALPSHGMALFKLKV